MFSRKKAKEEIAKMPSRKQTHYDVAEGDEVAITIYGRYENGTVKTMTNSYFIVSRYITDPDITMKKISTRRGKHA